MKYKVIKGLYKKCKELLSFVTMYICMLMYSNKTYNKKLIDGLSFHFVLAGDNIMNCS